MREYPKGTLALSEVDHGEARKPFIGDITDAALGVTIDCLGVKKC